MKSTLVSSFLVLTAVMMSRVSDVAAVRCYTCHGRPGGNSGADSGCGGLTAAVRANTTDGCLFCGVSATTSAVGGRVTALDRTCEHANHTVGCRLDQTRHSSHCYCNANDLCNDQPIFYLGSLDCYTCTSADFINNGCGVTLNPGSPYVHIASNCLACNTHTTYRNGITHYTRSCLHDIDPLMPATYCSGTNSSVPYPCDTRCTTHLCNTGINRSSKLQLSINFLASLIVALVLTAVVRNA